MRAKDFRNISIRWEGSKLCDKFWDCLRVCEGFGLESDYILFVHATSEGGIANIIDEVYEDGFLASGVYYPFAFPFSPINEKIAEKIKKKKEGNVIHPAEKFADPTKKKDDKK